MNHNSSRLLALGSLGILIALYTATNLGWFGPNQIGQSSQDTAPIVVPAGYAFAIWGPIYLGLLVFPVFQLIKKRNEDDRWIPLRQWYAANVVANGLWLVAASYDWLWTTVAIIIFMLYSLFRINKLARAIRTAGAPFNYWTEQLVFSLYFAWVTLATALNVTTALYFYEWDGFGISSMTWAVTILTIAALITGFVANKYRDAAYAAVVVWAFCALVVRHWGEMELLAYFSLIVAVIFSILMVIFGLNKRVNKI
ncbi:hypothetical protein CEQ90_09340 [Lewinellaceae bacterium SD302]|nr:hypothetical protein CEQ90_09340 [Lewinellaceae bacterium SD302]